MCEIKDIMLKLIAPAVIIKYVSSNGVYFIESFLDKMLNKEPVRTAPVRKSIPGKEPEDELELSINNIKITPVTDNTINSH